MVEEKRMRPVDEFSREDSPLREGAMGARLFSLVMSNRRRVIVAVCLLVFLVLLNRVLAGGIMALDRAAIELMVEHVRSAWLTPVMEAVSFMVTPIPLIACIFAISLGARARGHKGVGLFCAVNLACSTALNQMLKFAIRRPRPDISLRLVDIGGFSFPSGHSMAAMAFSACSPGSYGATSVIAACAPCCASPLSSWSLPWGFPAFTWGCTTLRT